MSDATVSALFSPAEAKKGLTWGVGPIFLVPTATDKLLGTEKLGVGPTAIILKQQNGWTYGASNTGDLLTQPIVQDLPDVDQHNEQIAKALEFLTNNRPSFAILDKGRSAGERSCIWVEQGHFYGMGYLSFDQEYTEPEALKDSLTRYHSNQYLMDLIHVYVEKFPGKVKKFGVI